MELTKEYFDSKVEGLVTKADLDMRLGMTETRLIKRIDDSQEELARMTQNGFADVIARLDVRQKVEQLEQQMHTVLHELKLA